MKNCCILAVVLFFFQVANGKTYYLRDAGNDNATGTSLANAWATISKLNEQDLNPGDSVLFEGGAVFFGTIYLDGRDYGTPTNPVVLSSWGVGRAIIQSGNDDGISAYNVAGIQISNLSIEGSGPSINAGTGIQFYTDTTIQLNGISIQNSEVQGYRNGGILIGAWATLKGFNDVELNNVLSHDNGSCGIASYGYNDYLNHQKVIVRNCKAYNNKGLSTVTTTNTGNGIVLSAVDDALIEYCEAYNNGELNRNPNGGPVGIWLYLVNNGVIQHCESHHNKAGLTHDGGGFDLDGGCQNSIIQYCYSHDNEGAGYLLAEYGSGRTFINNSVRYNISENDGRKNSYGAITLWSAGSSAEVTSSYCYNNTIYVEGGTIVNGRAAGIRLIGSDFSQVKIFNNIIYTSPTTDAVSATTAPDSSRIHLLNNLYYTNAAQSKFRWASNIYTGLIAWKAVATTQEKRGTLQLGMELDPLLKSASAKGTIGNPSQLGNQLTNYQLSPGSPAYKTGLLYNTSYNLPPITHDFFGNSINNSLLNIGADASPGGVVLPITLLKWYGEPTAAGNKLSWQVEKNSHGPGFVLERSSNGQNFQPINQVKLTAAVEEYRYIDHQSPIGSCLYRLKILQDDGRYIYSSTLSFKATEDPWAATIRSITDSANDNFNLLINLKEEQQLKLVLFSNNGTQLLKKKINCNSGQQTVQLEGTAGLPHGIYRINVLNTESRSLGLVSILH